MGLYSDVTFSDAPYIPQYAGLPLDRLREASDTLAERHYQNLARLSQLDLLARQQKTQVLPSHQRYVQDQIGQIQGALSDIAKEGGENATAKIAAMVNQYMGDETILKSIARRGEVQKEIDAESALRAAGKTPVRQAGMRERYMSADAQLSDEDLAQPYLPTVESFIAPVPEMEQIWDTIKPDAWYKDLQPDEKTKISRLLGQGLISPDMDLPLFYKVLRGQGISTQKIEQMLDNAMSSYKNQPSYRQQSSLIGKTDDQIKDELRKHGMLRIFSQVDPQYIQSTIADDIVRGKLKGQTQTYSEGLPGIEVTNSWGYDINAFDPSKAGTTVHSIPADNLSEEQLESYRQQGYEVTYVPPTSPSPGSYKVTTTKTTDPSNSPKYKQYLEDANLAAEVFIPESAGWTTDEWLEYQKSPKAAELIKQYQQLFKDRLVQSRMTPFGEAKEITEQSKQLQEYLPYRTVFDLNSNRLTQVFSKENKVSDRYERAFGDASKADLTAAGKHSPYNFQTETAGPEFAEAIEAQIFDEKEGEYRRILASPPIGYLETTQGQLGMTVNQLYTKLGKRPGQWAQVNPYVYRSGGKSHLGNIEARELLGAQRENFLNQLDPVTREKAKGLQSIIEVKQDGESTYYSSYEDLTAELLGLKK